MLKKLLCWLGLHEYKFLRNCPNLSYDACRCKCGDILHGMSVNTWLVKCDRCGKEKFKNDIPLG